MKNEAKLKNDGERMIPAFHKNNLLYSEHLTRYMAARGICKDKTVLDIASGSGYGTQILAETAERVFGVDIDAKAVTYANQNFGGKNIEFRQGSGTEIPLKDNTVDVVITFETIEHIEDYQLFMREIKRVLKPGGVAIISTPNDTEFAEGNHFHIHEFKYKEFQSLIKNYFKYSTEYFQATWKAVAIADKKTLSQENVLTLPAYNHAGLPVEKFLYFYFICSDKTISDKIDPIIALGEHYSERTVTEEATHFADVIDERNRVIADKDAQLNAVHGHTDELQAEIDRLRAKVEEFNAISNTVAYKVAKKAKLASRKINGKAHGN